ncbi:IS5 family transposase [Leptospira noguchii]|uniref:Transposase, IS4 family n=1 Tax=Leptospira noguchii str. 2007001578 TaxID=1049974 RepID=A0ABP2T944_9LEPT|nr:IS5 family transposase [Leptospira noguchii]EMN00749.1 transposase, IS4 family [Leptospira noguchii str. 2007001578]
MKNFELFESQNRIKKIENLGDPLKNLQELVDFEIFREELESMSRSGTEKGGRPPYDPVMMFKIIVLQKLYNLSDRQTEYQINDRFTFQRFLGVGEHEKLPDEKTIWVYRERLIREGSDRILFSKLSYWIQRSGFELKAGAIVDATIISVPIQRNTEEESEAIKQDQIPKAWKEDGRKLRQKDTDARWTKKRGKSYFGYKNHIMIDSTHKIIRDYTTTSANVHDSQVCIKLIETMRKGELIFGDSAYPIPTVLLEGKKKGILTLFCEKGKRNQPLSEDSKILNKHLSKVRSRVEHIFADIKSFGGKRIRCRGLARAELQIFLSNFVYNTRRFIFLSGASHA